jgi:hypothetical protein
MLRLQPYLGAGRCTFRLQISVMRPYSEDGCSLVSRMEEETRPISWVRSLISISPP